MGESHISRFQKGAELPYPPGDRCGQPSRRRRTPPWRPSGGRRSSCWRPGACIPASFPTCWWMMSWRPSVQSRALKIYVANIMTQEGETRRVHPASDHIRKRLFNHTAPEDCRLMSGQRRPHPPSVVRALYPSEKAAPIQMRPGGIRDAGGRAHLPPLATGKDGLVPATTQ